MNPLMLLLGAWVPAILAGADKVPAPNDVKAGWLAFAVFIALALAVAVLGFSLTRHLRKASDNAERGAFDPSDEPRRHTS
jgi:hypothetical protein